jgi:hypothetical protein
MARKPIHKRLISWALTVVTGVLAVPIIQQNVQTLATQEHWDVLLAERYAPWMGEVSALAHSWWFALSLGTAGGATAAAWGMVLADWWAERRKPKKEPLEISFDPTNSGGYSWFSKMAQSYKAGEVIRVDGTQYCVKITNNTDRTLSDVRGVKWYGAGYKEPVAFALSEKESCDLHPGASDYALVVYYSEYQEAANKDIFKDYDSTHWFDFQVGAPDVRQAKAVIYVDFSKHPAIRLEAYSSSS